MALVKKPASSGPDWVQDDPSKMIEQLKRRGIFMDISGIEGEGKSSLAMTLAKLGPLAYVDIDQSADRAKRPKMPKGRKADIRILQVRYAASLSQDDTRKTCSAAWLGMDKKVADASATWAKGVVIDTGTEDWELIRLGSFGTLTPKGRMDALYGPVNARFRMHLRQVYRKHGKHLITIHQVKDEYKDKVIQGRKDSIRTGRKVRASFKEIGYLSDISVTCFKDEGEFKMRVDLCKLPPNGPSLEGMEFEGNQLDFAYIVATATGTEREEWL